MPQPDEPPPLLWKIQSKSMFAITRQEERGMGRKNIGEVQRGSFGRACFQGSTTNECRWEVRAVQSLHSWKYKHQNIDHYKTSQLNNRDVEVQSKCYGQQSMFLFEQWRKDWHTHLNKSSYKRDFILHLKVVTNHIREKTFLYGGAPKNNINVLTSFQIGLNMCGPQISVTTLKRPTPHISAIPVVATVTLFAFALPVMT